MKNRKVIIFIISSILIVAAGILYGLEAKRDSSKITMISNLNKNVDDKLFESSALNQKDTANTNQDSKGSIGSKTENTINEQKDDSSFALQQTDTDTKSKDIVSEKNESEIDGSNKESMNTSGNTDTGNPSIIYIHICGQVKKPGVYKVTSGSRVIDVINLSGGLTKEASGDYVNQAQLVTDGQKIYIPSKDEVKNNNLLVNNSEVSNNNPGNSNIDSSNTSNTSTANQSSDKVNINNASKEELMTLPGIGESKANNIIKYREDHGSFQKIDDIKNIEGIKDGVFNKIKDFITI